LEELAVRKTVTKSISLQPTNADWLELEAQLQDRSVSWIVNACLDIVRREGIKYARPRLADREGKFKGG
jgi:hypothetical protein